MHLCLYPEVFYNIGQNLSELFIPRWIYELERRAREVPNSSCMSIDRWPMLRWQYSAGESCDSFRMVGGKWKWDEA